MATRRKNIALAVTSLVLIGLAVVMAFRDRIFSEGPGKADPEAIQAAQRLGEEMAQPGPVVEPPADERPRGSGRFAD